MIRNDFSFCLVVDADFLTQYVSLKLSHPSHSTSPFVLTCFALLLSSCLSTRSHSVMGLSLAHVRILDVLLEPALSWTPCNTIPQ
jgi:hypothetical protein